MSFIPRKIKAIFGQDSLDWADRSYALDWIIATGFWGLAALMDHSPVYERQFSLNDPLISHPHTKQQVGGSFNGMIALYIPLLVSIILGLLSKSFIDAHHGILSVWTGRGLARLITVFLKNRIGCLRPDFLSRCKWDDALKACTGKLDEITDGRKSFPSGHSSTAFAGMTVLSLLLASKTSAWCFARPLPPASLRSSRLTRLFPTLLPFFYGLPFLGSKIIDTTKKMLLSAVSLAYYRPLRVTWFSFPAHFRSEASHQAMHEYCTGKMKLADQDMMASN